MIRDYSVVPQKPQGPKSASHRINPEKIMGGRPLFAPAFVFPTGDQSCCSVSSCRNRRLIYSSSSPQSFSGQRPAICAPAKEINWVEWRGSTFLLLIPIKPLSLGGESSPPARSVDFVVQFDERPGAAAPAAAAAAAAHKYFR